MITNNMTIYALSTARGRAGIAVIRVSGPKAGETLRALTGRMLPPVRTAQLVWLRAPESRIKLDQAITLWFSAPHSFTGEDVVEFHIHGGRAVVDAVMGAIGMVDGLRPAEAGEFSRRAFDNNRMDLTEIEGLADLINAETEGQRRQALRQMEGRLGALYEAWRKDLIECLAMLEADIDFADEDLPDNVSADVDSRISHLCTGIETHLKQGWRGERLRDGLHIAILGAPNTGKSTLLNAIARRDVAIVSDIAGTTRDVIEVHLDLGGYPVTLADTAGIRDSDDTVEREGVRRAHHRAAQADLKILLVDARKGPDIDPALMALADSKTLIVINKIDLVQEHPAYHDISGISGMWQVSAKSGDGVEQLLESLQAKVDGLFDVGSGDMPPMTRARHRAALDDALGHLARYLDEAQDIELKAENVRLAARALGRITGRVDVEDVLDIIFSEFCIGK